MNEQTREWIVFAEEDWSVVDQLFINGKNPPLSVIGFHCQQCIEKYLKAYLTEQDIEFPKTHALALLLDLAQPLHPEWEIHRNSLVKLTNFAVFSRYPFEMPLNRKVTQNAVDIATELRDLFRAELGVA
jgi:HEPN domain-containing protein